MRLSRYPIATLKEVPSGAEVISHQLMLRAGMIKPLASGLYSWLPLGLRLLRKGQREACSAYWRGLRDGLRAG